MSRRSAPGREFHSALDSTPLRSGKSEYICSTPFSNDLPALPFDPKLLQNDLDLERFTAAGRSTLDAAYKHDLHPEPGRVHIELVNTDVYERAGKQGMGLAPEDAALITVIEQSLAADDAPGVGAGAGAGAGATIAEAHESQSNYKTVSSTQGQTQARAAAATTSRSDMDRDVIKSKGRSRVKGKEEEKKPVFGQDVIVPWLRAPEMMDPTFRGTRSGLQSEFDSSRRMSTLKDRIARPKGVDEIEASFADARKPIRHPDKPGEEPAAVMQVLPDLGRLGRVARAFVHIAADAALEATEMEMEEAESGGVSTRVPVPDADAGPEGYLIDRASAGDVLYVTRGVRTRKRRRADEERESHADGDGDGDGDALVESFAVDKAFVYADVELYGGEVEVDGNGAGAGAQAEKEESDHFYLEVLEGDGSAYFAPLGERVSLRRRMPRADQGQAHSSLAPSKCTVNKRALSAIEAGEAMRGMAAQVGLKM